MVCNACGKYCPKNGEGKMNHIIPVGVGDSLIDESNLQILCRKCHGIKSGFDRKIMNSFVKEGILTRCIDFTFECESIEEVIKRYKEMYELLKKD